MPPFVVLLALACGWSLGAGVSPSRSAGMAGSAGKQGSRGARILLGRSERGRLIAATHTGDPSGLPVLVFGCIHGTECAGMPVAPALERARTSLDLWVVPNLNPDGYAAGTRQNARGVDLNRNWSSQWPGGGRSRSVRRGSPGS